MSKEIEQRKKDKEHIENHMKRVKGWKKGKTEPDILH